MFEHFGENLILLERLAAGGMGEVYRARQTGKAGFNKTVAVKMILPHYAARPEFKAMFEQEMRICAKLQHPNVAQVFSSGEWNGYLYLVMEFIDGKTVRDLIQRCLSTNTRIPTEYLCLICSAVACGLSYAHGIKNEDTGEPIHLVHRDISPQNIMIGYNGEIKILDFGVAKAADSLDLTKPGDLKGNIAYVAPEAIEAVRLDGRADIFSLGAVAHELVTLNKLFYGGSTLETINNILTLEIPELRRTRPDLPPELDQIIRKTLERKRDNRYQSANEVHRDLSKFTGKVYPEVLTTDLGIFLSNLFAEEQKLTNQERKEIQDLWSKTESSISQKTRHHSGSFTTFSGVPPNFHPDQTLPGHSQTISVQPSLIPKIPVLLLILSILLFIFMDGETSLEDRVLSEQRKPLAWFKSDDIKTTGPVSSWPSTSNDTLVATQPEISQQPRLIIPPGSNHKILAFDGENDFLTASQISSELRQKNEFTIIMLVKIDTLKKQTLWSMHLRDKTSDLVRTYVNPESELVLKWGTISGPIEAASVPKDLSKMSLVTTIVRQKDMEVFLNGVSVIKTKLDTKLPFSDATYFSLGQEYDDGIPGDFLKGEMGDVAIFPHAMDKQERETYEKMFNNKFRIY